MILAGDVGGTKTVLAWFKRERDAVSLLEERRYDNDRYAGLEEIVGAFLSETPPAEAVEGACFGIAAPIRGDRIKMTNLPWVIDLAGLREHLGTENVSALNDLEAMGYGIETLGADDLFTLHEGQPRPGNAALIAAGTGLGEALLFWHGGRHHPVASEGGHTDFAPRNRLEVELLEYLWDEFDHVSYERLVSGPGLHIIYRFLRDSRRGEEPAWLAEALSQDDADPAAIISEAAQAQRSGLCEQALELFISLYGAEAGNLALKAFAVAGVYVGGGIVTQILDKLKDGTFVEAVQAKGRYAELMEQIPVKVILDTRTPLRGAARCAAERTATR